MNEFKAGDWAVFDTTKEFCAKLPGDLMMFKSSHDTDAWMLYGGQTFAVSLVALRHATPEEIKAGRRLP